MKKTKTRTKKKGKVARMTTNYLTNHFVICLDRSGSMQGISKNAVDTFNENANAIRDGALGSGQHSTVTLVTFGGGIENVFYRQPADRLRPYGYGEYRPDGGTPLFDAVGGIIQRLRLERDVHDPNVSYVIIVITDGEENASTRLSARAVAEMMQEVQATDRWSFAFLLPRGKAGVFQSRYGVPPGNVKEWDATAQGAAIASAAVSSGISAYYGARSVGLRSTKGFFTTDLSGVSAATVKKKLDDVRSKVIIGDVNRSTNIRDYVESAFGVPYSLGRAYYQLMKDEKVQHHKLFILRERATGVMYAGAEARQLLGMPDGVDVKVRPGDHAAWDVFVQSTSSNRKLLPGTKLAYFQG
jgi:hypothetical protein